MECNVGAEIGQVEVQAAHASSQVSGICFANGNLDRNDLREILQIEKSRGMIRKDKASVGVGVRAFPSVNKTRH